jgi:hypothetical protein
VFDWEDQDFLERSAELVTGELSLHEAVDWIELRRQNATRPTSGPISEM